MRRWLLVAAALIAVGLAALELRERRASPPQEEIDDASKARLREILREEDE